MMEEMTLADLPEVLQIEEESFASHWGEKDFHFEMTENPYAKLYVLRKDGKIVAYCDIWIIFERMEVASIAVAKEYRKQGLGYQIMQFIDQKGFENGCEFAFLEVRESNLPARELYKKCGYIDLKVKRDYYQDNHEDAYEMMKGLA